MTVLVKFCKPQHNPLDRCHTIRFGTIDYYRNMDPKFAIADPTEGEETIKVSSLPMGKASPAAAAAVSPVGIGPYGEMINCTIRTNFPNSYVWCCSNLDKEPTGNDGKRFDSEYTSFYIISNAQRFADYLASLLMTNISHHNFSKQIREKLEEFSIADLGGISLNVFHRPVLYVDSKTSTINEGFFESYAPDIPRQLRPIFVKPKSYSDDREYRFVFIFQHPKHGILHMQPDPVDLSVLPIAPSSKKTSN